MRQFGTPLLGLVFAALFALSPRLAQACSVPNTLTNGQTADATQVMANFDSILGCVNAAPAGSNGSGNVFNFTLMGAPSASQTLSDVVFTVPATYAAGLPEVVAAAGTAPTNAVSLSIEKNGSAIGSINWAAGAKSATVTFSSPVSFVVGDMLSVVAPATVDSTFANITVQWIPTYHSISAVVGTPQPAAAQTMTVTFFIESTSSTYSGVFAQVNGSNVMAAQSSIATTWSGGSFVVPQGSTWGFSSLGPIPTTLEVFAVY